MSATTVETQETKPDLHYTPETIDPALLVPFKGKDRPVYYDPSAVGAEGPHLRRRDARAYVTAHKARFQPENPYQESLVRGYLGPNADRYKGDDLARPMVCTCGAVFGNMAAASDHKQRFPDRNHDLRF